MPTAAELDRASYGSLVYLSRVDVHSALASSPLMLAVHGLAGLDGYDDDGWLRREAHHAVREAALGSLTTSQRAEAQAHMLRHAASLGIGSVHEMNGPQIGGYDDARQLMSLVAEGGLPEVVLYWGQLAADGGLDAVRELGAHGAGGDLFVDGAVGSRTACLRSPYADAPGTHGALYHSGQDIAAHLVACTEAGVQAGFHVIGDAAMDAVVHGLRIAVDTVGLERAARARGTGSSTPRCSTSTRSPRWRASASSRRCSRRSTPRGAAPPGCTSTGSGPTAGRCSTRSPRWSRPASRSCWARTPR